MAFLNDLLGRLKNEPSTDYAHFYVADDDEPVLVAPDTQYVRVWLRSARLVDVRRWTTKFFATVHAHFAYPDRTAGQRELVSVISPEKSFEALDPKHIDRLIVVNQPLLGPIPYRGELAMEVALFSIAATDLAKPYLELLSDLSGTASVAFLSQLKPFVDPIKRGAQLLFKSDGAQLEIGFARTDNQLRTGNIVVARVPKGSSSLDGVHLDPNDFGLLDRNGKPISGFPYLVLGIEATTQRSDYAKIPEVRDSWNAVRGAAEEGRPEDEVRQRFDQLRRAVWLSADLVQADKKRIVEIFNREINDAGFSVAPPREAAVLEGQPALRALRTAELLLEELQTHAALEGVGAAESPITMAELQRMMRDPDIPDSKLKQYFTVSPAVSRPFAPAVIPDPARVTVSPPGDALEGAMMMDWANGLCRLRRQAQFRRRQGEGRLVLVSEGDSWFQFPIFLEDVIDNLLHEFNIWSVDAAGDTLQNMVVDNPEYMQALRAQAGQVRAFLFSGGGNDIVGEDERGRAVIAQIIRPFEADRSPAWYLDNEALADRLRFIEACYRQVITNVAAEFPRLPVICHGYDYVIPGGAPGDERSPLWAKQDQWIGRAMRETLGIRDPSLQRAIVRLMIDRLNERIRALCGGNNPNGAFRTAFHVDVRGTVVPPLWADELHPTDEGYTRVAQKFAIVLRSAIHGVEGTPTEEHPVACECDSVELSQEERAGSTTNPKGLEASVTPWRVANALLQLKRQVDSLYPNRSRLSDGTIGDGAHATRNSDHNPWVQAGGLGVVTAMDITHDPLSGCTGERIAEALRTSRDPRIKYIIWNRRICSSTVQPWVWRAYTGANPHDHHVHLSVKPEAAAYDSQAQWRL
ncbi:hypothetical protein [Zoogloea sp. LCSB751]|uniref:hypothetical protein n=1 Tax=Zoogloea sp. LCSB751 TaxID=1965277 RepID=UPI001C1F4321|nr:hypothetical protein [Zoogloea sp. LCSB751]